MAGAEVGIVLPSTKVTAEDVLQRYATTLIMKLAYGHQILSDDDDYIKIAENTSRCVARSGAAGATPPDFMPIRAFSGLLCEGVND